MKEGRHARFLPVRDLKFSVGIAQPGADHPRIRVPIGEVAQPAQRQGGHFRVIIQEEQIASSGEFGGLVAGSGEAAILGIAHQQHLGVVARHHLGSPIDGVVVHDDDFKVDALRPIAQRFQAFAQHLPTVPIGDTDRNVYRSVAADTLLPGRRIGR